MPLHSKAAAITAAKDFLELVCVQYNTQVKSWMSDAGGEYKSDAFDQALLEKGIIINQSAPQTPMQNGCAERLMRTLMDKAEVMQHQACCNGHIFYLFILSYRMRLSYLITVLVLSLFFIYSCGLVSS